TPATAAGKAVKCPKCRTRVAVPDAAPVVRPAQPDPAGMPTPPPYGSATVRGSRRRPAVGLLVGGAVTTLLLGLLLGWFLFGQPGKEPARTSSTSKKSAPKTTKLESALQEKPPPPIPVGREFTNSIGMKMVQIPAGKFRMGSSFDEEGRWDDE